MCLRSVCTGVPDQDALDALVDMREFDVPYHMRFQIDTDVRCGHWFTVRAKARALPFPACWCPPVLRAFADPHASQCARTMLFSMPTLGP